MKGAIHGPETICSECGRTFPLTPDRYLCPDCAAKQEPDRPLRGILDVQPPQAADPADPLSFLPVDRRWLPPIPVGNTPLWAPDRLRSSLDLPSLFIKDDGVNPTGSLKDRASFLVAAFARAHGISSVCIASTGNAGSSMAGIGAAAGLSVTLFLPAAAPEGKLVQALQYGARVFRVDGTYDDAYDLSMAWARQAGGISRNTAYNPLTIEGKKTVALELFRDLGRLPDVVYVPVGDGVILSGVYKGFRDLEALGITHRIPEVVAVQAAGSCAIARAMDTGGFQDPVPSRTMADSISVDVPRNGRHAVANLTRHHGRCVIVEDMEIRDAQHRLAAEAGLFAEPAAACAFAGLVKDRPRLPREATVVVLSTGNGLKDVAGARTGVTVPSRLVRRLSDLSS